AVEVGGAYGLEDCYTLVRRQEKTHTPFMFMENCCFNKDELLATSMARKGLFGEIVYCEGAYGHDLREEIVYGKENRHYRLNNYLNRNCENYPTHELLPIMRLLHINRGNRMLSLVSVASKARGLEQYIEKHQDKVDPSLRNAKFAQGDVVDTIITCAHGETIHLRLDTTLPRFYDRGFTVRGTKGMYMQTINAVLLDGEETHEFEPAKSVKRLLNSAEKYEKEFLPPCWRDITPEEIAAGHGGMDSVELRTFFDAVKNKSPMPIDVYDCAAVTCVSALSEASIAMGGAPVAIPDFTGGKWVLRQPEDVMPL
ncbi:MAG: gfo/Idh/MocA family oxidoreductase, partial [Clostridia bacterium]|nr:gfo/Idh/MocA family oxidoreductase [Clostridia bacterium]